MYLHKYGNNGDSVITEIILTQLLQAQNKSKCDSHIHLLKQLQLCMHVVLRVGLHMSPTECLNGSYNESQQDALFLRFI